MEWILSDGLKMRIFPGGGGGLNVAEAYLWTPGFTELKTKKSRDYFPVGNMRIFLEKKNILFLIKCDNLQILLLQQITNTIPVITQPFIYLMVLLADAPKCSHT